MKPITNRQYEVLRFIRWFITDKGYSPSIREVGNRFNITVKGAYDHLKAIEKKGHIRMTPNVSRSIVII